MGQIRNLWPRLLIRMLYDVINMFLASLWSLVTSTTAGNWFKTELGKFGGFCKNPVAMAVYDSNF